MIRKALLTLLLALAFTLSGPAHAIELMEAYGAEIDFDTAMDNLKQALLEHGLVIAHESHVGEMLERTGKDLGDTTQIYQRAEIVEFCSAVVSRAMMKADPRNVAFCPFTVALYVLPKEPKTVYAAYRRPAVLAAEQSVEALQEAEKLLRQIAHQALGLEVKE